jgi:hypothetical protein
VIEVAGQVVLELGDLGLLHMAMLAMLGGTVKGHGKDSTAASSWFAAPGLPG